MTTLGDIMHNRINDLLNSVRDDVKKHKKNIDIDEDLLINNFYLLVSMCSNNQVNESLIKSIYDVEEYLINYNDSLRNECMEKIIDEINEYCKIEGNFYKEISILLFSRLKYLIDNEIEYKNSVKFLKEIALEINLSLITDFLKEYYFEKSFSFGDYSGSVKNILLHYVLNNQIEDSDLNSILISSIKMAGDESGSDFKGLDTLEKYMPLVDNEFMISDLCKQIISSSEYNYNKSFNQVKRIIVYSNIDNVLKGIFINEHLIINGFKKSFKKIYFNLSLNYVDTSDFFEPFCHDKEKMIFSINNNRNSVIFTNDISDYSSKSLIELNKSEMKYELNIYIEDSKVLLSIKSYSEGNIGIDKTIDVFSFKFSYDFLSSVELNLEKVLINEAENYKKKGSSHRIEYLWIKKYKVLSNESLYFSNKYKVEKKDKLLTITKRSESIDHLLYQEEKKLSMVNSLVGENGSGKTTVLEFLSKVLSGNVDDKYEFIVVFENIGKVEVYSNINNLIIDKKYIYTTIRPDFLSRSRCIYYSPISEQTTDIFTYNKGNLVNLSSRFVSFEKAVQRLTNEKNTINETYENIKRLLVLEFLMKHKNTIKLPSPNKVMLCIRIAIDKNYKKKKDNMLLLDDYLMQLRRDSTQDNSFLEIDYVSFDITECINDGNISELLNTLSEHEQRFELDIEGCSVGELMRLTLFAKLYWSSLSSVKRIAYFRNEDVNEIQDNSMYYFLDEPDVFLHPAWKINLVYELKWFVEKCFENNLDVNNIHIIVTSNSPFMMSDIPLEHNMLLEGKSERETIKQSQTFAQNIHDILNDTFFLTEGSIGKYASYLIEELISILSDDQSNKKVIKRPLILSNDISKEEIKSLINIIGEPIIKSYLESSYEKKYGKIESIESQLAFYKRKIKILEEEVSEAENVSDR